MTHVPKNQHFEIIEKEALGKNSTWKTRERLDERNM